MKTYTIKATDFNINRNMTATAINSVEVSEQAIRDLLKANPELLKDDKKLKFFNGDLTKDTYYILDLLEGAVKVDRHIGYSFCNIKKISKRGIYNSLEEATIADEKRMAIVRCWNWADENAYFRPDWSDKEQGKYDVYYGNNIQCFGITCIYTKKYQFTLPYFKSQEDAEAFINSNKADLELLFLK